MLQSVLTGTVESLMINRRCSFQDKQMPFGIAGVLLAVPLHTLRIYMNDPAYQSIHKAYNIFHCVHVNYNLCGALLYRKVLKQIL